MSYYLVERAKGPVWDHSRVRREQPGWDDHAAFMDGLAEEGFVVLGGPIGEGDGENALLVIDAEDEATIRARLAADPWPEDVLTIESIRLWTSCYARSSSSARMRLCPQITHQAALRRAARPDRSTRIEVSPESR